MSMIEWAEDEVKLACENNKANKKEDDFDYTGECYKSALKAYKSLCEDGHSGMSFGITKSILIRLMNSLPLTPIEDTPENWQLIYNKKQGENSVTTFQSTRMSSLFKDVFDNGTIKFYDNNKVVGVDLKTGNGYFGFACRIVEEMFPITMPYYPTVEKYKVCTEEFIAKGFEGDDVDYNTICISYVITPENKRVEINRYFGQKDDKMVEINESEYKRRLVNKREKEEK